MSRRMLRWLVDLDCGDTVVVLTTGDDPTLGHTDDWFCRECGRRRVVKAVHKAGWETAPALKLRDQP
jgi:DNA-directed RNA polymerase subunit RPC12/RpoP